VKFNECLAQRQKPALPDPSTMPAMMGISPDVPHEIEVQRLVKAEKKRTAQAPPATSLGTATASGQKGLPRAGTTAR
jgi:hypothetical protein